MSKLDISGDPKSGAIPVGFPHCIALADYIPLILVNNFKHEVCSDFNNNISRAFRKKKVNPKKYFRQIKGIFTCFL